MTNNVDDFLVHFGVKGMKWGIRKDDSGGYRLQASPLSVAPDIHPKTKLAGEDVARLMNERYGFQINSLNTLGPDHPSYDYGTLGFVKSTPGVRGGDIYVRKDNLNKTLKDAEDYGWLAKGCGHSHGFLTHEASHALFHAEQKTVTGFMGPKITGGNIKARNAAMKVAVKGAKREGIPPHLFASKVSGYAEAAGVREEVEAELFSQYHWGSNPPRFVKSWGETLHRELGVDGTPFREVVNRD